MARARIIDSEAEAPPQSDQLAGWPHPRETGTLYGQPQAEATIAEAIASGRLHHGWLVTGEEGTGKATFAYRLARFLLAQPEELPSTVAGLAPPDERVVRQVASLSHPGLFVVRRAWDQSGKKFRQSIAIDEVRALRHFLQRTAASPWRVVIVDTADDLNLNSANALLKSLEEPPVRTVFLILSNAPGRLLPTIRSRCRVLRLEPLGREDLRHAVADACALAGRPAPDSEEMPALARLGRGSVRRVLQLMEGNALGIADALTELLAGLPKLDRLAVHKLAGVTGSRETESYTVAFDLLEEMLAEALRAASLEQSPKRFPQLRPLTALMKQGSLADWAGLWETIASTRGEAERLNLDKAALLITVFEKIGETARAAARA